MEGKGGRGATCQQRGHAGGRRMENSEKRKKWEDKSESPGEGMRAWMTLVEMVVGSQGERIVSLNLEMIEKF